MSCETSCFEKQIPCCESIVIDAGFTADDALQAIITRPGSSKVYQKEVVVGDDAVLTLEKSWFPAGFFGFGYIKVELKRGDNYTDVQTMKFKGTDYNCLLLQLVDIDDSPVEEE